MLINQIWNYLVLKRKQVKIGNNLRIQGRLFCHGDKNRIIVGDNVTINSSSIINPTSGANHSHLRADYPGMISIGNNVGLSHVNITSFSSVVIEDNVLIGSGVKIWDTDFHPLSYEKRIENNGNTGVSNPILIKEGAFIGACSIILKGVTIGKHSIVGAGSVVTKDIPDNQVWAGNPAHFIRNIFS